MPHIGLAVIVTGFAIQPTIDWRKIILPFFIVDINNAFGSKKHGVAAIAGRHNAIKHIHTQAYTFQYIPGGAHTHEVAGAGDRKGFATQLTYFIHHWFRLSYT